MIVLIVTPPSFLKGANTTSCTRCGVTIKICDMMNTTVTFTEEEKKLLHVPVAGYIHPSVGGGGVRSANYSVTWKKKNPAPNLSLMLKLDN